MASNRMLAGTRLPRNYERLLVDLTRLANQVNGMIADGSFYSLPYLERRRCIRKLKRLYDRLVGPVSWLRLRHVLAASAVLVLGLSGCRALLNKPPAVTIQAGTTTVPKGRSLALVAVVTDPDSGDTHTFQWYVDDQAEAEATTASFVFSATPAHET